MSNNPKGYGKHNFIFGNIKSKLLNIKELIKKHWHILNIDNTFGEVFKTTTVIAFRKNTSFRQIIGAKTTRGSLKFMKNTPKETEGECTPHNESP